MTINAITQRPKSLINAINNAINKEELKTWAIVIDNKKEILYTHTPEQWNEKAMLKAHIYENRVSFRINWWIKNGEPEERIKGYILGRFTEILMVHFKEYFLHLKIYK